MILFMLGIKKKNLKSKKRGKTVGIIKTIDLQKMTVRWGRA